MSKNALKEYFEDNCITVSKFCKKAGLCRETVYKVLQGKDLYLSMAMKIENATNKKVKCQDIQPKAGTKHNRGRKPYKLRHPTGNIEMGKDGENPCAQNEDKHPE